MSPDYWRGFWTPFAVFLVLWLLGVFRIRLMRWISRGGWLYRLRWDNPKNHPLYQWSESGQRLGVTLLWPKGQLLVMRVRPWRKEADRA